MYTDRIGIHHKVSGCSWAASQRNQAKLLLDKAQNQSQSDPDDCSEEGNHTPFKQKYPRYQFIICSQITQCHHICPLINNKHGKGTYHIKTRNHQNKSQKQIRDEFLYLHNTKCIHLLLISVLYPKTIAQNRLYLLLDTTNIDIRL